MVPTLLKQMRRLLQIKKIIPNLPSINKKRLVTRTHLNVVKKAADIAQKKSYNWPMMSFIYSGSEIRTYRASTGYNLDGIAIRQLKPLYKPRYLIKNILISFKDDAESILLSILIYSKLIFGFCSPSQIIF